MTLEQFGSLIQNVIAGVMLAAGIIGTLWAAVRGLRGAKAEDEERKLKRKKELDDQAAELEAKLNKLRGELHAQMESRISALENELLRAKKRNEILRTSGLMLIEAIEDGLRAREAAPRKRSACGACLDQDKALLLKLQEVKILFEKEGDV